MYFMIYTNIHVQFYGTFLSINPCRSQNTFFMHSIVKQKQKETFNTRISDTKKQILL